MRYLRSKFYFRNKDITNSDAHVFPMLKKD